MRVRLMSKTILTRALLAVLLLFALACGRSRQGSATQGAAAQGATQGGTKFRVETFVTGLEGPWSTVFTSPTRMLVAERPGRVRVVENGKLRAEPLATISDVEPTGESGLMGLTLH